MKNPITYAEFRDQLKKGITGGWLFYGEEAYLKQHSLFEARKAVLGDALDSVSHRKVSCFDFDIQKMSDALATVSLFDMGDGGKRLTEFHELQLKSLKEAEWKALTELLSELPDLPDTVLIVYTTPDELDIGVSAKSPSKEFSRLAEHLTPVCFARESDLRLLKWIGKHFASAGISFDEGACDRLLEKVGHDMFTLSNEISKLCAYLGQSGRNRLTQADVELVCCSNLEADSFAFTNALLERNCDRAYALLNDMRLKKEKSVFVFSAVAKTAADLYTVRKLTDAGMTVADISKKLKIHEYKAKLYVRFAKERSERKLRSLLEQCCDIDLKMKSTALDDYTMLSRLVVLFAAK